MESPFNGRKQKLYTAWAVFVLFAGVFVLAHFAPHGEHSGGADHNCAICHAWSLQSVPASPGPDLAPDMPVAEIYRAFRQDVTAAPSRSTRRSRAPPQFSFFTF